MLGRVGILEAVAGNSEDHLGAGLDLAEGAAVALRGFSTAVEALEEGGHRGGAGRLDKNPIIGGEPLLGGQDLGILDDLEAASRLGNGGAGSVPTGGATDPDGRGHGLGIVHRGSMIERGSSCGLNAEHPGQLPAPAEVLELLVPLPVCGDVPRIADGEDMDVGSVAEFLDDLKGSGLLTLDAVGIDRVDDGEVTGLTEFADETEGVVEVAPDGDDGRPVDIGLDHLASGDAAGRKENGALHSGAGGVGGGRCGGISRGGAEDGMGSLLGGLGDCHRHASILEGAGGIESLVLHVDLAAGDGAQLGRVDQRGGTLAQRDDGRGVGDGQELPVA